MSTNPRKSEVRKALEGIQVIVFLTIILLPLCDSFFDLDNTEATVEKRQLAARPEFGLDVPKLRSFASLYEQYYNDHFGFRDTLIQWHSLARTDYLGISPVDKAVVGRDGWLFLGDPPSRASARGVPQLTNEELLKWQRGLEQRRDWLEKKGIKFLFVVAPDKHSIYPEFVPPALQQVEEHSHIDQLFEHLDRNSTIEKLDLRPALITAKNDAQIYHKMDTHWNAVGAYAGYSAIRDRLASILDGLPLGPAIDVEFSVEEKSGGDIARMIGVSDDWQEMRPKHVVLNVQSKRTLKDVLKSEIARPPEWQPFATVHEDGSLPKAVMFRDSFSNALIPYLSEHFGRITYLWQTAFSQQTVLHEKPDVVILERVERLLKGGLPEFIPREMQSSVISTAKDRPTDQHESVKNWSMVGRSQSGTTLWRMSLPGAAGNERVIAQMESSLKNNGYRRSLPKLNWWEDGFTLPAQVGAQEWAVTGPASANLTVIEADTMTVSWVSKQEGLKAAEVAPWVYLFWDGALSTVYEAPEPGVYQLDFRVSGSLPPPIEYAISINGQQESSGSYSLEREGKPWHLVSHAVLGTGETLIQLSYTNNHGPRPSEGPEGDRNMWVDELVITPVTTVLLTTNGEPPSDDLFWEIRALIN